jgi:hypothetical protein
VGRSRSASRRVNRRVGASSPPVRARRVRGFQALMSSRTRSVSARKASSERSPRWPDVSSAVCVRQPPGLSGGGDDRDRSVSPVHLRGRRRSLAGVESPKPSSPKEWATNGALLPTLISQSHPTLSGLNGPKVPCSWAARHSLPNSGASHGGQGRS